MALGPRIRGIFGPYERHVAEAYRVLFLDIDALVDRIRQRAPDAKEILEVGCGEGASERRLPQRPDYGNRSDVAAWSPLRWTTREGAFLQKDVSP